MPWKETCAMKEKLKFIHALNQGEQSFAQLCRQFEISRKTGYKWVARYEEAGEPGLIDKAPVARSCPHAREAEVVDAVVELRKEHPTWGPKKLLGYLERQRPEVDWPASSTIGDWLKKYGQIRPRRRRVRAPRQEGAPGRGQEPNQVWCVDFKGWLKLGDGVLLYPLTITDEASRSLLMCQGLLETDGGVVRRWFERAFREFGLPDQIKSDNGPPFATVAPGGLSELSVWWIKLQIVPVRIEPAQPQQNGRHERMHRTLGAEAADPPRENRMEQQRAFDQFRREYNELRPHEALGQTPPAEHYRVSRRSYPRELVPPEYPDMEVRWTNNGQITWRGRKVVMGPRLSKEPVGLRQIGESQWEVFYGPVWLGMLDERDKELRLKRPAKKKS